MAKRKVVEIHVLCRDRLNVANETARSFESSYWRIADQHIRRDVLFALHQSKKSPSYLQGYIERLVRRDSYGKVTLLIRKTARPLAWGGDGRHERSYVWANDTRSNPPSNPPWSRDELILALDLYMRHRSRLPSKTSPQVAELSEILNKLAGQGRAGRGDYRNRNGVYMKLMNFRRFDPEYTATGKVGLARGNSDEQIVWNLFASDPVRLRRTAQAIRDAVTSGTVSLVASDIDVDGVEAEEGAVFTRMHRQRERDRKIIEKKKSAVIAARRKLACEVCNFSFEDRYGERGEGFIECHHVNAIGLRNVRSTTKLSDLVLVCANCHRMIHRCQPWLTVDQLRELLR